MTDIIQVDFPKNQYVQEVTEKRQIVLHHTASGPGVTGDIAWWKSTSERVATHYLIDREGLVYQLFNEKFWGYHLGLSNKDFSLLGLPYKQLDKCSIGIELDCWGPVVLHTDGKFYPAKWNGKSYAPNTSCKPVKYFHEYCQQNKWKGSIYWEKYTTRQLDSLEKLVKGIAARHNIPMTYNNDIWNPCNRALSGTPGLFSHCSYRKDKSDVHPQPELINLLKSL